MKSHYSSADDHLMFLHCMHSDKWVLATAAGHSQLPTPALRHHPLSHSLAHYSVHTGLSFFSNIPRLLLCRQILYWLSHLGGPISLYRHELFLKVHTRNCASVVTQLVKNPPAMRETLVRFLGWEDLLEKGKATPSSILAWRIPWIV